MTGKFVELRRFNVSSRATVHSSRRSAFNFTPLRIGHPAPPRASKRMLNSFKRGDKPAMYWGARESPTNLTPTGPLTGSRSRPVGKSCKCASSGWACGSRHAKPFDRKVVCVIATRESTIGKKIAAFFRGPIDRVLEELVKRRSMRKYIAIATAIVTTVTVKTPGRELAASSPKMKRAKKIIGQ